jgi:alanyl-tRNA synthetase
MVRILSESSIAAGIRRIEAITGKAVEKLIDEQQDILSETKEILNNPGNLISAVRKLMEENTDLKKQINAYQHEKLLQLRAQLMSQAKIINGIHIIRYEGNLTVEQAKTLAFQIKNLQNEKLFFITGNILDGKPSLTVVVSDDLVAKGLNAAQIIREISKEFRVVEEDSLSLPQRAEKTQQDFPLPSTKL